MAGTPEKMKVQTSIPGTGFAGPDAPADQDLYRCVHCGLCLDHCPTYLQTGLEMESPRGRIALMKAVREGRVPLSDQVRSHWDMCLQCRACEAVCPSGVPYGRLMERTRAQVAQTGKQGRRARLLRRLAFRVLLARPRLLYLLGYGVRAYERSGARWLMEHSGLLRVLPQGLADLARQMPAIHGGAFHPSRKVYRPSAAQPRLRVALLSGCVMAVAQGAVMEAAVRVLVRNGCEVVVPPGQGCCGALCLHGGDIETARAMARRNIDVFLATGVERIVVASAGCGSAMKEYHDLLRDDPLYADKAAQFSAKVKDITELLASLPVEPPKAELRLAVTYQDSCHLAHAQRVTKAPRQLLQAIPGLVLKEMQGADICCGAAGSYSLTQRAMSRRLQDDKVRAVKATGAQVIATANPGCILQLQQGLRRHRLRGRVVHVVELLDEAYRKERGE